MKRILLSFVLLSVISCKHSVIEPAEIQERSNFTGCGSNNPVVTLPWMQEKINSIQPDICTVGVQNVIRGTYEGETVFLINVLHQNLAFCCFMAGVTPYNCKGEPVLPTSPKTWIAMEDIKDQVIVWKNNSL